MNNSAEMSSHELNVVIVGAGQAGAGLHLPAFRSCAGVRVVGICDPHLSKAREVARAAGVPGAYENLEQALDRGDVNVVSICAPPALHLPLARKALEAGCDVLLEKPMTVTLDEADELMAVHQKTGRKLCVVHQNKFTPGIRRMVEIVRSGEPGDVLQLHLSWLSNGDLDRMTADRGFWCHSIAGGRWAESLPHQLYIAYSLVGELQLRHVEARKRSTRWPWMDADEVLATFESAAGYVTVRMSANLAEKKRSLNLLHGTRSSYAFSYKMATPLSVVPPTFHQYLARTVKSAAATAARIVNGQRADKPHPHLLVIRQFVDHLRDNAEPPTTVEEAYHVMKLTHDFGVAFEKVIRTRDPSSQLVSAKHRAAAIGSARL
jgi:predicted dehydrogenase